MAITTTGQYSAPFLQPLGGLLADYTAGLLTQPQDISGLLPHLYLYVYVVLYAYSYSYHCFYF